MSKLLEKWRRCSLVVKTFDLQLQVQFVTTALSRSNLRQVVHTHVLPLRVAMVHWRHD